MWSLLIVVLLLIVAFFVGGALPANHDVKFLH